MAPFGHAALSGLGAYAAALTLLHLDVAWPLALVAGAVAGAAAGRLAGIACARAGGVMLAMLTLAFAQVVWSIAIQWDSVTGGSNGLVGTAPTGVFGTPRGFVGVAVVTAAFGTLLLAGVVRSRFGAQLRAARDAPTRAAASGIDVARVQARAFAIAGAAAGLAGALQALAKGSLSPDNLAIARSVDALAMVLLGGVASPAGPVLGATAFTLLQDFALREIVHWQLALGIVILALALALPRGLSGLVERVGAARTDRPHST
jgi:branched-chain amino acid transport system permease protein